MCRLDYPGIGPEHSYLKELGRAEYFAVTDKQALDAFELLSKKEGIIPALETAHAFAYLDVSFLVPPSLASTFHRATRPLLAYKAWPMQNDT